MGRVVVRNMKDHGAFIFARVKQNPGKDDGTMIFSGIRNQWYKYTSLHPRRPESSQYLLCYNSM